LYDVPTRRSSDLCFAGICLIRQVATTTLTFHPPTRRTLDRRNPEGLQNARLEEQTPLHPGHSCHLPTRLLHSLARHRLHPGSGMRGFAQLNEGGFAMINLFSGGALLQLSIFALGIMPYITASIIVQLLRVVIPRFESLHKEGASGQAKLTQY